MESSFIEPVEPRVRRVVAEELGVNAEELTASVSLTDELAADSLDLVELTLALEAELGIVIPEAILDTVRSFGDLVAAVQGGVRRRDVPTTPPLLVAARVVSPSTTHHVHHAGPLTPYTAETIAGWAFQAGAGAELEISLPDAVSDAQLSELTAMFSGLRRRGIHVTHRVAVIGPGAAA